MQFKPLLVVSLVLAVPAALFAADEAITVFGTELPLRPADPPQDYFGLNLNRSVIQVSQWQPVESAMTWVHPQPGYLNGTTNLFMYAPLDLDAGAQVTQACLETQDTSTTLGVILLLGAFESAGPGGAAPFFIPLEAVTTGTTPAPGFGQLCVTVDPVLTIRSSADLDGSGGAHTVQYWVGAQLSAGTSTGIGPAVITWRRTTSPAPAAATFTDVPTTHAFFRFVEAMAASGITGGCATGTFCPDDPVTRGQMSVFLAAALGLYWPN